jgi:hypothetical protein
MAAHGLSENHERGLLASVQYASRLIRDCKEILAASNRQSPLNRYTGGLTPPQRKIVKTTCIASSDSCCGSWTPRASRHRRHGSAPSMRSRTR